MSVVRIYHNPHCSKSRQALALLAESGIDPEVILYLETPPTVAELAVIVRKLGIGVREIIRTGEDEYRELGLEDPALSDDELLAVLVANPVLIQRPIVIRGSRAVIGRPVENIHELIKGVKP